MTRVKRQIQKLAGALQIDGAPNGRRGEVSTMGKIKFKGIALFTGICVLFMSNDLVAAQKGKGPNNDSGLVIRLYSAETKNAWNQMLRAEQHLKGGKFKKSIDIYKAGEKMFRKIPLFNVDKALRSHIQEGKSLFQEGANLLNWIDHHKKHPDQAAKYGLSLAVIKQAQYKFNIKKGLHKKKTQKLAKTLTERHRGSFIYPK